MTSEDTLDFNSMTSLGSHRGEVVDRGPAREMKTPELPMCTVNRQELEDYWCLKLQEAHRRYQAATARYRRMLQMQPEGLTQGPDGSLTAARQAESQALAEYTRVLRIFTDLTVHSKIPEERSTYSPRQD